MQDVAVVDSNLWRATAVPPPALPQAPRGRLEAEFAVVGAGFAGLSTALQLAERGRDVVVLEAGAPGDGASGRCGGHVLYGGRLGLAELVRHCGEAAAHRLHAFGARAADEAFALVERHALRCDASRSGSLYVADSDAGLADVRQRFEALRGAGVEVRWLQGESLAQMLGSDAYRWGYLNPRSGGVQPLSLVRELARVAQAAGARLFERAPVLGLARQGSGWRLRTPGAVLDASRVLLATNGQPHATAGTGPWPLLARCVLPVWSQQLATAVLPASCGVLPGGPVVSDARRLLNYFRVDRTGRLVMGGKGLLRAPRGLRDFALQRRAIERIYPALAGVELTQHWGGRVSVTAGRRPRLFALDAAGQVLASVACNGKGVAWNLALGPVLADAMCGVPVDRLPLPPLERADPIPLHGLRPLYAAVGTQWMRWLDRIDHGRRRPDRPHHGEPGS